MDGDAMAAGLARRLDHRLGRDARRPPAGAVRPTLHRAALRPRPPHRHQLAPRLRRGPRLQALLLPARQRRSQDPGDRRGLAPHPPEAAPGRWAGHAAGLRHRRLAHQAVRAARRGRRQASQPDPGAGRVQVPLRPRLGLPGPAGPTPALGDRSPCRSSRTCTSEPRMSAGWRPTTAGSSTPSWSWPPPRSSGWSSSWGPITRRSGW